jgi:hypothetical protein
MLSRGGGERIVTAGTPDRTSDRIVLTLPGDDSLNEVATLVVGGVGSRLDLPYERLDDLQLAVVSVLGGGEGATVTIDIDIDDEVVSVTVSPLSAGTASDPGLHRVLSRLVDSVEAGIDQGSQAAGRITLRLRRPPVDRT